MRGYSPADGIWSDRCSVVYQNEGNLLLVSLLLPNVRTISTLAAVQAIMLVLYVK